MSLQSELHGNGCSHEFVEWFLEKDRSKQAERERFCDTIVKISKKFQKETK